MDWFAKVSEKLVVSIFTVKWLMEKLVILITTLDQGAVENSVFWLMDPKHKPMGAHYNKQVLF
jgi:hypothetical protein